MTRPRSSRIATPDLQLAPSPGALLFSDDFDGPAGQLPSAANWGFNVGRYGAPSGENQYYTNVAANASLDGSGNLAIVARKETPPDAAASPNDFTSARLTSRGKREFAAPVRLAARIKVPYTRGILPAWWTIGAADDWPHAGEIDLMESPAGAAGTDSGSLPLNLHGPTQGSPTVDKSLGRSYHHPDPLGAVFRVYAIDWYADRILWHLDGRVRAAITQADYTAVGGDWTAFNGTTNHYLLLNIAVGNDWTGDPDGTSVWPQTMLIDWVRAWSLA